MPLLLSQNRPLNAFFCFIVHLAFGVRYNLLFNHTRFDTNKLILRKLYKQHYSYVKHVSTIEYLTKSNQRMGGIVRPAKVFSKENHYQQQNCVPDFSSILKQKVTNIVRFFIN